MIRTISLRPVGIALVSAALSLSASVATAQKTASMPAMSASGAAGQGSDALMQVMTNGMKQMQGMQMSGNTDKDFAMMMKAHHQQAIDMAQIEISGGKSAELKAMARKMMSAQQKEIGELDRMMKKMK